jgi:dolichol-phosphate mannosyltransferase
VTPARNEAGNIGPMLDALGSRLQGHGIPYEIIVVDDGSEDATAAEVSARSVVDSRIRLLRNPGPCGFGRAIRHGLAAVEGDAVAIMMADGSDSPDDLIRYYAVLGRAECAFGSRFLPGSRVENYPTFKLVINRIVNFGIRLLFGLSYNDVTNAFKAYRVSVIRGCAPLLSAHFNLTVELPLKAIVRGYSYEVLPISWRQRRLGTSALRLKEMGSRYLFILLYVWLEKLLSRGDYHRSTLEPLTGADERVAGRHVCRTAQRSFPLVTIAHNSSA